jgi:hypothetical protein
VRVRFQADANLDPDVGLGFQRRDPAIDYSAASGVIPRRDAGSGLVRLAAEDGRLLVTNDLRIPKHFADFIASREAPGILLIPPRISIREAIEGLFLCRQSWTAEEIRDQIRWLPRWQREKGMTFRRNSLRTIKWERWLDGYAIT